MSQLPIELSVTIESHNGKFQRKLKLQKSLTTILGPNGSGKTHLLRGLKQSLQPYSGDKKVRFISAGRIGSVENFRSDFDGHRGGSLQYDHASHGSKDDNKRRHQIETLNGDFQTIAARPDILIKIQERLKKLFNRDILIDWDAGSLKILFAHTKTSSLPYSSGREASGLLHLVGILSALYDDEVGVLLIDEPEVSLHPQLQSFLLKEIISVAGLPNSENNKKLIVIATHSTEMIKIEKAEDLLSLVFCYDLSQDPLQISPDTKELKNDKIKSLINRLGQSHKLSLFAKKPLLIEGISDEIICKALANKTDAYLEAAGSQLLPVIGKGEFTTVCKLFKLMGKEPVVLADADCFTDEIELTKYFLENENDSTALNRAQSTRSKFFQLIEKNWSDIRQISETHEYWLKRDKDKDEMIAKRRAAFSSILSMDKTEIGILPNSRKWAKIKSDLENVLSSLEDVGCFILRKGSIESYYRNPNHSISAGKPDAASVEMMHIVEDENLTSESCDRDYGDIVRCIKYAANSRLINEFDSLKDILIPVAALALSKITSEESIQDIEIAARSSIGDRSKLFKFELNDKKELKISINSNIIDSSNFPLVLKKGDNVNMKVEALNTKKLNQAISNSSE